MVHDGTAPAFNPGTGSFDNPALREDDEPGLNLSSVGAGSFGVM